MQYFHGRYTPYVPVMGSFKVSFVLKSFGAFSAHFPNDFVFNYFYLVIIRMVEILQNVSGNSKSLS